MCDSVIQSVQEGAIHYNEKMIQLQNKASLELKKELKADKGITPIHAPNMAVLERHLNEYERSVNSAVERFKDLGNLHGLTMTKSKILAQDARHHSANTRIPLDQIHLRFLALFNFGDL